MEEGGGECVPEGCIAHVMSMMSPRNACRLSVVSRTFRSAAASDTVWERFLPPDYSDPGCSSKKDLFFRLCHHPLLLHAPTPMSFWLDKSSGAKCYMLLARALSITWSDTPVYWAWNRIPDARFGEVAELLRVYWLEIVGRIGSSALSPKTAYAAYLVFKIADDWSGLRHPKQETCVTLGGFESKHTVCLQPDAGAQQVMRVRVISPRTRSDGWMEVEMGEFYNETGEDGEVEMSLREIRGGNQKNGLIVQGIEIRPNT